MQFLFGTLMFITSLFLILLVLVQRGRGGGLAGAFGGMGGQSAFGTKAGDLFTRLTMGVAAFWILLCVLAISVLNHQSRPLGGDGGSLIETLESGGAAGVAPDPLGDLPAESGDLLGTGDATPSATSGLGDSSAPDNDQAGATNSEEP